MRVLLAVIVVVLVAACGDGENEVDCGKPVDYAAWREATTGDRALEEGDPERVRRSVAAQLVECGTIDGKGRAEVLMLLGRSRSGEFYLGPDFLHLDDEVMMVVFDRDRRVKHVLVAQT